MSLRTKVDSLVFLKNLAKKTSQKFEVSVYPKLSDEELTQCKTLLHDGSIRGPVQSSNQFVGTILCNPGGGEIPLVASCCRKRDKHQPINQSINQSSISQKIDQYV